MKSRAASFAFGFVIAACVTSAVAFVLQKRLRDKHADCPLDSTEVFLRSMATMTEAERSSVESMFSKFTSEGTFPVVSSRMGAFRAVADLYELRTDDRESQEYVADVIVRFHAALESAASDREMMFRLGSEMEQTRKDVDGFH